jgi:hypothetical protein
MYLRFFAVLWGLALLHALYTGRARSVGGVAMRSEQPIRYWLSVGVCAAMVWLFLSLDLGPVR